MVGHVKKPKSLGLSSNTSGLDGGLNVIEPTKYDLLAFTILKKEGGGYDIISVEIDSYTLSTGKVVVVATAEGRAESVEKFKINVVKAGIV
jgi:hypothetical protein